MVGEYPIDAEAGQLYIMWLTDYKDPPIAASKVYWGLLMFEGRSSDWAGGGALTKEHKRSAYET